MRACGCFSLLSIDHTQQQGNEATYIEQDSSTLHYLYHAYQASYHPSHGHLHGHTSRRSRRSKASNDVPCRVHPPERNQRSKITRMSEMDNRLCKRSSTLHCKHVFSTNIQIDDFSEIADDCGDWFWQLGEEGNWQTWFIGAPLMDPSVDYYGGQWTAWMCKWGSVEARDSCKDLAIAAATRGAEWFKCAMRNQSKKKKRRHEAVLAWSLKGQRSCPFQDAPMQVARREDCPGAPEDMGYGPRKCTAACTSSFFCAVGGS